MNFGRTTATAPSGADGVDFFFGGAASGMRVDCWTAADIMMARGVEDTLQPEDFNESGFSVYNIPLKSNPNLSIGQLALGDWAYFADFADYSSKAGPDGEWAGENVIKVGTDQYWGFGLSDDVAATFNQKQIYYDILTNYNAGTHQQVSGPIPGYQASQTKFVNVGLVGMRRFDAKRARSNNP